MITEKNAIAKNTAATSNSASRLAPLGSGLNFGAAGLEPAATPVWGRGALYTYCFSTACSRSRQIGCRSALLLR